MARDDGAKLWNRYRADRKAIYDRYQPYIDAIWKKRGSKPPHPATEQALRHIQEHTEWQDLRRRQLRERRTFDARERSFLGFVANTVALRLDRLGKPGLSGLFKLIISGNERHRLLDKRQEAEKQGLRKRQAASRKARADVLAAARRHELAQLSNSFEKDRLAMLGRHGAEAAFHRLDWQQLTAEREKIWADYKREFVRSEVDRKGTQQGSPVAAAFQDAAHPVQQNVDTGRGQSTGANERVTGWRERRSAGERRTDGSYRSRTRGDDRNLPGGSKERTRSRPGLDSK